MIEYTVMDYEGEPVTIEDGEIGEVDTPRDIYDDDYGYVTKDDGEIYWDSDDVEWKFKPDRSGSLWELETYCYYQDRI